MTRSPTAVGDTEIPQVLSAFVSLNLNPIPATANVTRVVLNLSAVLGQGNAFEEFGAMTVDHVNVVSGILASDYTGGTLTASIATIQPFTTPTRDVAIDVTSAVNADRAAGRPISSFRFRFDAAPGPDGETDVVLIQTSPEDAAERPSATVTITQ